MPIKPENKALYPNNWKEISEDIRVNRAKNKCEVCGVPNHAVGYRDLDGKFNPTYGNILHDCAGNGLDYPSLELLSYSKAKELADFLNEEGIDDEAHYIVIVLTTAHLDHNPANCDCKNLKALCQRCHNRYDLKHRNYTRRNSKLKNQLTINFK
jgi:hypothetical protein